MGALPRWTIISALLVGKHMDEPTFIENETEKNKSKQEQIIGRDKSTDKDIDLEQSETRQIEEQRQKEEDEKMSEWASKRALLARTPVRKLKIDKEKPEHERESAEITENFQSCTTTPNSLPGTGASSAGFFEDNVFTSPFFRLSGDDTLTEKGTGADVEDEGGSKKRDKSSENIELYEEDEEAVIRNILNIGENRIKKTEESKTDGKNKEDQKDEHQEEVEEETPLLTLKTLEKLEQITKDMQRLIKENTNTKREIKDNTKELARAVKKLKE